MRFGVHGYLDGAGLGVQHTVRILDFVVNDEAQLPFPQARGHGDLLVEEQGAEAGGWEQPEEDRRAICEIRAMLDEARLLGNAACREYGVSR